MMLRSLVLQRHPLAEPANQLRILDSISESECPSFHHSLTQAGVSPLRAGGIRVLQLNLGKVCNQTCAHCHVDAGPQRRESMSRETAEQCLGVLATADIPTLDLTGGAPEMNPHFRWLVCEARRMGRHVIDRSNLTILVASGFDDLPDFLADQRVEIVASLPCYSQENCDRQRGEGVFERSMEALRRLNRVGFGRSNTGLILTLVYNPIGPNLPPPQDKLEAEYRLELHARYGIEFSRFFTITNMPISRFLADLLRSGQYEAYLQKLVAAFNPATTEHLMCRTTLSVDWRGFLYDCDFNQMLDLPVADGHPKHIRDFRADLLENRPIMTARHCFGCTAGAGSSCQGTLLT